MLKRQFYPTINYALIGDRDQVIDTLSRIYLINKAIDRVHMQLDGENRIVDAFLKYAPKLSEINYKVGDSRATVIKMLGRLSPTTLENLRRTTSDLLFEGLFSSVIIDKKIEEMAVQDTFEAVESILPKKVQPFKKIPRK